MNGLEIYNEILDNTHNLKGTWEVTENNYLNVTGNTNGSIVLFDKTVGALGDFILEWTAEQKGGSYIHSNLCPSLRYTPEDAGIEGGGDNYSLLVYLCNYGGNPGTFNFRTESGTKSTVNTSGVSLNLDTVYTFRLERLGGMYRLYQDGILINEATDITKKKLYLGWYLWYGGTNSSYQTNFILREYNLTKIDTKSYLDSIGLTSLWSKIKSLFATKTELASKANDSDVIHKSGDETVGGVKTFSSKIVGNLTGNADTATKATSATHATTADSATKATQDSDGNPINTTYLPLSGGHMTGFFIGRNVDNSFLHLSGCTDSIKGATLVLYGEGSSDFTGSFRLIAHNSSTSYELVGNLNGELLWGGKHIVRSVNDVTADQNGNVHISSVQISNDLLTENGSHIQQNDHGSFFAYDNNRKAYVWNSTDGHAYFYGQADKAVQDSDGNPINTTYIKVSVGVYDIGSTIHACTSTQVDYGATVAGSALKYAAMDAGGGIYDLNHQLTTVGTWLKVSGNNGNTDGFGLYRRIA